MIDTNALIYGAAGSLIGGLITYLTVKVYKSISRKNILNEIESIELEKQCLESMKKSSVEMNRRSFSGLFYVLILISLANITHHTMALLEFLNPNIINELSHSLALFWWIGSFIISLIFYKRYVKLKNYSKECIKLIKRQEHLKSKIKS